MRNICVITGEETSSKTNNISLSREGRSLLSKITNLHNEKIADKFVEASKERNKDSKNPIDYDFVRSLSPKITEKQALRLLEKDERDIVNTRNEVLNSEVK